MKFSLPLLFFLFCTLSLSAQCFDYQSEMQNVENYISGAIRSQKKAMKEPTLEEARQLIDKSVFQMGLAITSINLAKEYASACGCDEGVNSATNLYDIIFDYKNLTQNVAENVSLEELTDGVKKNLVTGEDVTNEISEAVVLCPTQ